MDILASAVSRRSHEKLTINGLRGDTPHLSPSVYQRRGKSDVGGGATVIAVHIATHNATHDRGDMHVLGRTYAAVRDLQVVKSAGKLQTEKAALCHCSGVGADRYPTHHHQ